MTNTSDRNLLSDYSGYGGTTPMEAFELFDAARTRCPVSYSQQLGGFHILLEYEDVQTAHRDAETFSSADGMFRPVVERMKLPPTEYDNPEHDVWRKGGFDGAVNARTPKRIEDGVRADANELIDRFAARGSCDLVAEYTDELPLRAMCRVLGFDIEKGPELRRLTVELLANLGNSDGADAAMKTLADYGAREVEARRTDPREDVLTELTHAELGGRTMTREEISKVVASLIAGGHETTVAALANLLYDVLSRPEIKRRLLEDSSLIPAAVEETLRLHPPFMGFYRTVTKQTTVKGVTLNEGDHVMLCWASANRDPKQFEDPLSFRLDRKRNRHMSFGLGVHFCIGAPTARMVMRVGAEELLRRLPDLELADSGSVHWEFGGTENVAIPKLDVRFTGVQA
ncbi:cytochrome P450 [Nocardia fusca]|uniref:cytochrome P450 n=1 Tax=Nocardia fusca TaxID=941183 RepID=UPI0037CC25E3